MGGQRRKITRINQASADKYITEGLLNNYRFMAETEVVRVPPIIYKLLELTGALKGLRLYKKLIRAEQINVADGHWLDNQFSIPPKFIVKKYQ